MSAERDFGIYKIFSEGPIYLASLNIPHSKGIEILDLIVSPSSEHETMNTKFVTKSEIPYKWIDNDFLYNDNTLFGYIGRCNPNKLINSLEGINLEIRIPKFEILFPENLANFH